MVVKGTESDYPEEYVPYRVPKLKDGIVDTDSIKNGAVTANKIAEGVIPNIINDLKTNDSTSTLSAAQGKVIADSALVLKTGLNILDPLTITPNARVERVNGTVVSSNSGASVTDYLEIPDEGLICNSTYKQSGTDTCGCVLYDGNKLIQGSLSATSNGESLSVAHSDTYKYVRFNLYPNEDGFAVYKGTELPSEYVPYAPYYEPKVIDGSITKEKVANNAIENRSIVNGSVSREKTDFIVKATGKNKCNPNDPDFKLDVQITATGNNEGNEYSWVGTEHEGRVGCTGFIPVTRNGLILNHYGYLGNSSGFAVYDSNKNPIRNRGERSYIYTYQEGDAFVRFTFDYNYRNEIQVEEGSVVTSYEPYSEYYTFDETKVKSNVSLDNVLDVLQQNNYYPDTIQINLPDKIYAVRGDLLQIFYQGIVVCPNIELYDIVITCSVGKGLHRYYEYDVPDNASLGNKSWTITVKDANGNILATKSCILVVVDKAQSPISNKNILCIGDSLTSNGIWASEMKRRLVGTIGSGSPSSLGINNVTFVGRKSVTPYGLINVNIEGNSGWSWESYIEEGEPRYRFYLDGVYDVNNNAVYTNNGNSYSVIEVNNETGKTIILTSSSNSGNIISGSTLSKSSGNGDSTLTFENSNEESTNPFWHGQQLDFVNYVENVCELTSGTQIDFAYILMTWNGVPQINGNWDEYFGYVKTFIDALHTDYPNCKVKLMGVEFIYPQTFISATSSQDSMSNIRRIAIMNDGYQAIANDDDYSSFVEFVNVSSQFDSKYNMTNSEKDVNTRNSSYKERYTNNSIHP